MQDLAITISLILFFVVWWFIAKQLKPKRGFILRNILGMIGGFIVMGIAGAVISEEKDKEASTTVATAEPVQDPIEPKEETKPEPEPEPVNATPAEATPAEEPVEVIEETQEIEANEVATTPEVIETITLGLSSAQYLQNLNASLKIIGLPFQVSTTPEIKEGETNNTFIIKLDDLLALSGTMDKNNQVMSTILIGTGDGTEESGYKMMLAATASFMAAADAANEAGKEKYGKVFFDLMKEVGKSDSSPSNTVDGVKFTITPMGQMGTWFTTMAEK